MTAREASKMSPIKVAVSFGPRPVRSATVRDRNVSLRSVLIPKVSSVAPRYISTISGSTIANSIAATPRAQPGKRGQALRSCDGRRLAKANIMLPTSERLGLEGGGAHDEALAVLQVGLVRVQEADQDRGLHRGAHDDDLVGPRRD